MSDDDLEELGSELVVLAARLVRAVRRDLDQPAGVRVLSLLDQHGPRGVSELAAADSCSQPTMSGTVTTLVDLGWVTKTQDPRDARVLRVGLTDAGRAHLAAVRRTHGRAVADRLAAHDRSPADVAAAVAVLRDVLDPPQEGPR
ncbi:MarR family transcriptional regulator [Nocardioides aestuarii]|uniref:MarR family winged helix-turn-helix transcriptional regulator n=1 Tax=Nocardioides aestuarii TaxID=252231 RepID=A0ABW4TFI3_9ACTN